MDLRLQPGLFFLHPPIAHGFVLGGVCLDLRPINGYMAQRHHPSLLAELQHLHEQVLEGTEVPTPELADGLEVRRVASSQHPERHILMQPLLNLRGDRSSESTMSLSV